MFVYWFGKLSCSRIYTGDYCVVFDKTPTKHNGFFHIERLYIKINAGCFDENVSWNIYIYIYVIPFVGLIKNKKPYAMFDTTAAAIIYYHYWPLSSSANRKTSSCFCLCFEIRPLTTAILLKTTQWNWHNACKTLI